MLTSRKARIVCFAITIVLALFWLVPIAMMLAVSFMPSNQRSPRFGGLLIEAVSLDNYINVFHDAPILAHFVNSIVITFTSVFLVVLFGSLAAYAFAMLLYRRRIS